MKPAHIFFAILLSLFTSASIANDDADPAEVAIGERLFLETRFAQSWYVNPGKPDPALAKTITTGKPRVGSYAKGTMNCRACHMVDEHQDDLGMRTYADYAMNSPIPNREDGNTGTTRNSMSLVNISKDDIENILFHFDGEFNSLEDLVVGTLTGRNFGWKATEKNIAIKHIANIVRDDDGKGELANEFGGSYRKILSGTDKAIPVEFQLPVEYRVNTKTATDQEIVNAVAKLITAYTNNLGFATDESGFYSGSPYDAFLNSNNLPRAPEKNESPLDYGNRLLSKLDTLKEPVFVSEKQGSFKSHNQKFVFGKKELKGLQLFLRSGSPERSGGNCASCHQAPHFTDFRFHNTGISQNQYDKLHGTGAFNKLIIPGPAERNKNAARYLPATEKQPNATSVFRSKASKNKPGHTDLGLWNVAANPDITGPQEKIKSILCAKQGPTCTPELMLKKSIAAFKTPGLRDTGHSAPYMHTGELNSLVEVITMYVTNSQLARQGGLRNTGDEMLKIKLNSGDIDYLLAFLNALNEDYE